MEKLLLIIVILLNLERAVGQDLPSEAVSKVEQNLWKAHLILPGIEYERALGSFSTVNINPYFELGYSSSFVLGDAWLVQPSLDVQLRRYYNLPKRAAKGKKVEGNSANLVALNLFGVGRSIVDAESFRNHHYYGLGPVWGFQRTYRSNFNLSFQAGLAYITDGFGQEQYLIRLNLRLGLALRRRAQY